MKRAFKKFILKKELADLSSKTIENYKEFLFPFLEYVGMENLVENIVQEDIDEYINLLIKKPLSRASKATYIRHLKIFLSWVEKEFHVAYKAEEIRIPKSPKKNVRIYTKEEVKQIFEAVTGNVEWLVLRNKSIIALMYDSGLRQAEICSLQISDIVFHEKRMTVHGKGNKERIVPIGNLSAHFLKEYLEKRPYSSCKVFVDKCGNDLNNNAVKLMVTKLSNKLSFRFSSHKLRHNFATNYLLDQYEKNGQMDIFKLMCLMGHEDIETTKRYLHMANEVIAAKENISHLDKIFKEVI